eukprot:11157219-Lingulodinium_polyedra.AAC.1
MMILVCARSSPNAMQTTWNWFSRSDRIACTTLERPRRPANCSTCGRRGKSPCPGPVAMGNKGCHTAR